MPRRNRTEARRSESATNDEQEASRSQSETNDTEESRPRKRVRWGGNVDARQDEDEEEEETGEDDSSSSHTKEKVRSTTPSTV